MVAYMDKMVIKVPVMIKAKVTEDLKAKIVAELQESVKAANLDMEQFEFSAKRAMNEQANQDGNMLGALQEQIELERAKRTKAKADVEAKLARAEKLELGSEVGHGQLERTVEIEIGSNLEALLGAEILTEDGKVIAFRA
jgi:hypothetical protein